MPYRQTGISKGFGFKLFLVTGCMRSGTSLLHNLISSSSDFGMRIAPARYLAEQINLYNKYHGKSSVFSKDYFQGDISMFKDTQSFINDRIYAAWVNSGKPDSLIFRSVDFAPNVPLIAELIPDANILISVRDPKDNITSMIKVRNKQKIFGSSIIPEDIKRLCKIYNRSYLPTIRALKSNPGLSDQINFLRYEDAAQHPDKVLSGICAKLNLAPGSLEINKNVRESKSVLELVTHRYWRTYVTELHNGPASTESIGSHKKYISASEAKIIDRRCRHIRRKFGY
jgi:hypothetical protein